MDIMKALKTLETIEAEKIQLYTWYSEALRPDMEASILFGRLAMDQEANRNLIQYLFRIAMKNPKAVPEAKIDLQPLEEIREDLFRFRQEGDRPLLAEALRRSIDVESRTEALLQSGTLLVLSASFEPFISNLTKGCRKHALLLDQMFQRKLASRPGLPEPGPRNPQAAARPSDFTPGPSLPGQAGCRIDDIWRQALPGELTGFFQAKDEGVHIVSPEGRLLLRNLAAEQISSYLSEMLPGDRCGKNPPVPIGEEKCRECEPGCPLSAAFQTGRPVEREMRRRHQDGRQVPLLVHVHPLKNETGDIVGAIQTFRDLSAGRASQEKIAALEAFTFLDPLTGVANRRRLETVLQARFDEFRRYGWGFGVILVDIQDFNAIYEIHGRDIGDFILKKVGRGLTTHTRVSDVIGRWEDSRFLAVLPNLDGDRLEVTAEKLCVLVAGSIYNAHPVRHQATISVGAAPAGPDDTVDTLLSRAAERVAQFWKKIEPWDPTSE